jgi:hypothetical protein
VKHCIAIVYRCLGLCLGLGLGLGLGLTGCKQGIGERCQVNADCASNHCSMSDPQICVSNESNNMGDIDAMAIDAGSGFAEFTFLKANNPALASDVTGTIAGTMITVEVPMGTTVTALVATFTLTGASVTVSGTPQVSNVTAHDFTNPVVYAVTALDGRLQDDTVTVMKTLP